MGILIVATLTIAVAFAIHLALWKIRLPRKQTRGILIIFFGILAVTVVSLPWLSGHFPALGLSQPVGLPVYLHLICFVTAMTLAYMITYSAVEVDSPSLIMVHAISRAGAAGLPVTEFDKSMTDALLVEPRIKDTLRDDLVRLDGELYRLTPKGERMARLFILHRTILRAGKGG